MLVHQLPTPCLTIDRQRMLRNLARMQQKADAQGVTLRPHTKTHKSLVIGRNQLEIGARGITVAKPSEAEVFVDGGFDDVRIAYPVIGADKLERILQLTDRAVLSFCVDTLEGARAASTQFARAGQRARVLLKIDCGYGRAGVPWDLSDGVELGRALVELPGIEWIGILTHAGQSYDGPAAGETKTEALGRVAGQERERMLAFARHLLQADLIESPTTSGRRPFEISIGSTPSIAGFENAQTEDALRITEIRPGTYVFNDLTQVALGAADLEDCALTILATVVSRQQDAVGRRVVIDAGKKILTSDARHGAEGYGMLLESRELMAPLDGTTLHALSEEHGWVRLSATAADLAVGDRVHVVPNHVCVAVNTQDRAYLLEGETVVQELSVDARGRVQ